MDAWGNAGNNPPSVTHFPRRITERQREGMCVGGAKEGMRGWRDEGSVERNVKKRGMLEWMYGFIFSRA